jgi:hypothetical protein
MGFSDTLKEMLDQGLAASKEFAAKAGEKAQDWSAKGIEASKDFASRAGAKIQELGEKGVLLLEIKQLEGRARKLISFLGAEIYRRYMEDAAFGPEEPEIKDIFNNITAIKETIDQKEEEMKAIGKTPL